MARASAQVILTQSDMPQEDDAYILTFAADFQTDPELTGPGFFWDFSQLSPLFSVGDTFVGIGDLPSAFLLFFFTSDLADQSPTSAALEQFGLEGAYTVYTLTSSKFQIDGYAAELLGLPFPMVYSQKDILYKLPLQYGQMDSADAALTFSFPGLFYFSQKRHRVNHVDGWGTVTTPVGTFDCLRIKSVITDQDSLYIDTLQYGSAFTLETIEYKWLAPGMGLPVVQVNAQVVAGYPVVSQIIYQDTAFRTIGIAEPNVVNPLPLFPNPATQWVRLDLPPLTGQLNVWDAAGRLHFSCQASGRRWLHVAGWPVGLYLVTFVHEQGTMMQKLLITRQ
ncbi:MAG: T9SS type A sorting domain-containing protein [Chitinophagales bacterium]|nr:T9SS type A sorting domain-containing protein [Chitinophagales bacterium]